MGLIVGYKVVKAAAALGIGVVLLWLVEGGFTDRLVWLAVQFRHHVVEDWSIRLAQLLIRSATVHNLRVIGLAALIDGASSLLEGWALYRRLWWSAWLIVCTTSAAIPFEVFAVVRHASGVRIAILVTNVLIVLFLMAQRVAISSSRAS